MQPKTSHAIAVLKAPKPVAKLLAFSKGVLAAITAAKATFPSPTPPTAQLSADIDALDVAETNCKSKAKGTAAIRDEKYKVLMADLHKLVAYVQQVANSSPEQAVSIIEAAGFQARKTGPHPKSDLAVTQHTAGSVKAVAKATKGARLYEWQYSTDGKTWTAAPATTRAKTTIDNLPIGALVTFRHRPVTKDGSPGDWTAPVTLAIS